MRDIPKDGCGEYKAEPIEDWTYYSLGLLRQTVMGSSADHHDVSAVSQVPKLKPAKSLVDLYRLLGGGYGRGNGVSRNV